MFQSRRIIRRRSGVLVVVALTFISVFLTGCGPSSSSAGSGAGEGNLIGISLYTNQVARFNFEEKKMKEVAKQNGDRVISNFANNNLETQISQIQSMMQRGIKVLILNQINSKAFAPIVKQAQTQGIKVIAYDEDVAGAKVDYLVQRDNVEMGAVQAQSVLDHLPAGRVAKVAIIRGDPSTPAMVQMSESYDKMILSDPKIDVVYDNTTPGWDQAAAQRNAEAALQKDPDIDAFLVMWDNGAQAVAQAVNAAGKKPGTVWSTGSDGSPASLAYIAKGWQGQTTWTAVDKQATNAMDIAHAFASGEDAPEPTSKTDSGVPVLKTPLSSVTRDDLCDFITKVAPEGWATMKEVYGANASDSCA